MATVARLKEGNLFLTDDVDERLPVVRNGLTMHVPMDDRSGCLDIVGGAQPSGGVVSGENLAELLGWRDPANWGQMNNETVSLGVEWDDELCAIRFRGYKAGTLKTPLVIDTTKTYTVSMEIYVENKEDSSETNTWRLYIGGYREDILYRRTTVNNDYSIKSSWQPALGGWYTVTKTYTPGDVRYSSGWKAQDGTTPAGLDAFTRYWWFGGLWNYWGGANSSTLLRNLVITTTDADTSNVVCDADGCAIEEASTNSWSPTTGTYGWQTNYGGTITAIDTAPYPRGVRLYKPYEATAHATTGHWHGTWGSSMVTMAVGEYYAVSFYARKISDNGRTPGISLLKSDWTGANCTAVYTYVPAMTHEWQRYYRVFLVNEAVSARPYIEWTYDRGMTAEFCGLQIEKVPRVSAYRNGALGDGTLTYPVNINALTQNFTFSFELAPNGAGVPSASYKIHFNNFGYLWQYYPCGGDAANRRYIWDYVNGGTRCAVDLISPTVYTPGQFETLTCTWNASTKVIRWYRNGVYWNTRTADANAVIGTIDAIVFQKPQMKVRNVSLYNRILSDAEIVKLAKTGWAMVDTGSLTAASVSERVHVPAGAVYFPLIENGDDTTGTVHPSEMTNCAFVDGAVWVGSATTNLLNGAADVTPRVGTVSTVCDTSPVGDVTVEWTAGIADDYIEPYKGSSSAVVGNAATSSVWLRAKAGSPTSQIFIFHSGSHSACGAFTPTAQWKQYSHTITVTADSTITTRFDNDVFGDTIECSGWMFEKKPFASAFTLGTRGASALEYNLYNSIGMDWSGNWTIIYWKKPMGTYTDTLTGYCIESLGCNSNTVGGGYVWWGKNNSSNAIMPGSSSFTSSDYFNRWHMVSLSKSGSTITIKHWHIGGATHTGTATSTTSVANYYVTPHGYDLKLGGWDNGNPPNAYFRDLIVVKGTALTDAQLQAICDTQMRVRSGSVQVTGQVFEGGL